MTVREPVPEYPAGNGPEIERLARMYSTHPDLLEDLLTRLRALEEQAWAEHQPVAEWAARHDPLLGRVCEHHGPVGGVSRVYCGGCDSEEPLPDWPCSTWTMIAEGVR